MKLDKLDAEPSHKRSNHSGNVSDDDQKNKNKKQLIKRKRFSAYPQIKNVNLKHIVNISDIWFINEQTLKDPDGSTQNIQRAMFRYKMISRIVLNSSFVGLQLKKVDDNYLPPEYFFQRFRSLGDRQIAQIANDLQSIYITFNQFQTQSKQSKQEKERCKNHQAIDELNQFLKQMEGKMYTIYFVEISKISVNLKHLFFSIPLLQKLGWNIKRVASDFLKYRHVFFEIFSPKYYKEYIQTCLNNYFKAQQLEKDPTLTREQKIEMTTVYFDDEVVREVETDHGVYEEFLRAKVKFSCPNAAFCCVQILSVDENPTQRYQKKKKRNEDLVEISPEEEITLLKKLGFENSFLEMDNNEERKEIKDDMEEKGN